MQAQTILPVQGQGASGGLPARGPGADDGNSSGEQFSQALTREIGQRQQQPRGPAATAAPGSSRASAAQGTASASATAAKAGDDGSETVAAADAGSDASAAAAAADLSAIAPVTDMLALAAALNPVPAAAAPTAVATGPAGAASAPEAIAAAGVATALPVTATATDLASHAAVAAVAGAPATHPQAASLDAEGQQQPLGANATQQVPDAAGASLPATSQRQAESATAVRPAFADFVAQAAQLRQASRDDAPAVAPSGSAPDAVSPLPLPPAPQPLQGARAETQPAPTGQLPARVGTPAWDNQVGQQVVWMAGAGEQTAELTLNPPDLGPMRIVLAVSDDKASIAFTSAQPEVRQALEAAMPRLRDMLGETGLSLGDATVSAGTPGDRPPDERRTPARSAIASASASGDGASPAAATPLRRAAPGLVDTFA